MQAVVGSRLVAQQTPRAVTLSPPSLVTVPPLLADVLVIRLTAVVMTVGVEGVVNGSSLP